VESFLILAGLFANALAAATILPVQSEALLVGLLLKSDFAPWLLITVASLGNILGSCINWALGRSLERFRHKKWFPASDKALARAQECYARGGKWWLLLSWVPVIGDPLTIMAGVLRERLLTFVLFVAIAKTARYLVVAAIALNIF
jgi:membrane protein YqaA with SNARE-associated domain